MDSVRELLASVKKGTISVKQAERLLRLDAIAIVDEIARLDVNRYLRRGVPEIVYAAGKTPRQLAAIVSKLVSENVRTKSVLPIIISRVRPEHVDAVKRTALGSKEFKKGSFHLTYYDNAKLVAITNSGKRHASNTNDGRVALIAAGTSDIPALNEAEVLLNLLGCRTIRFNDVGVAALQRLTEPLKRIFDFDPDAIVVAAGMEGALPSLIAGLSYVPVIGLPTSVGYGYGRNGEAALMSMLQACPMGLTVVNIDAGVAAGVVAALIAKRASRPRGRR